MVINPKERIKDKLRVISRPFLIVLKTEVSNLALNALKRYGSY